MNLRVLEYLIALAEHCHFGKAAEICFVSQPTLSMQIKKLEERLGVLLLERTNKSVMLTEAGRLIVERAKLVLNQVDEIYAEAKLAGDIYAGDLKLGIIPTLAPYLLPHIMPDLVAAFPKLTFYLYEEKTNILMEKLKHGFLDAIILALPLPEVDFHITSLFEEEFVLAVDSNHILSKRKMIKQHELKDSSLLLLDEGHCLRDQALSFCQQISAKEQNDFRATSLETLRHMVASGSGMTLIPKLACQKAANIVYIPFVHPKPLRKIGFVHRKAAAKNNLLTEIALRIKKPKTI